MVPHAKRPRFPGSLLRRTRCPDTSSKATLWMKAQHVWALTPTCIIQENSHVPHRTRQVACHPMNNSRGKRSSIPPHKTRPDSHVTTLQGPCDLSQIRPPGSQEQNPEVPASTRDEVLFHFTKHSGVLRAPTNSTLYLTSQRHPEKLSEVTGTSQGNPGFPAATLERHRESFFNPS